MCLKSKNAGKFRRCIELDIRYGKSVRLPVMPAGPSAISWHFHHVSHDRMKVIPMAAPQKKGDLADEAHWNLSGIQY